MTNQGPNTANKGQRQDQGYLPCQKHPRNRARKNTEGIEKEQKMRGTFSQKYVNPSLRNLMYDLVLKHYRVKQEEKLNMAAIRILQKTALTSWRRISK